MSRIEFFVAGLPAPQGSKRYMGVSGGRGVMVESSKAVKPWRADVREGAERSSGQAFDAGDAVAIRLAFVMPRPTSTPKRRTPPAVKRPDLDKLIRAVLDALSSAGVWVDDSQVVDIAASKRVAELNETPGCRIALDLAQAVSGDAGLPEWLSQLIDQGIVIGEPLSGWQRQTLLDRTRLAQSLDRPMRGVSSL